MPMGMGGRVGRFAFLDEALADQAVRQLRQRGVADLERERQLRARHGTLCPQLPQQAFFFRQQT
jgi:hypothetical protein